MMFEAGIVKKKEVNGRTSRKDYVMNQLNGSHIDEIMALQQVIVRNLSRPDMLASFSRDFMKAHLGAQGFVIGVWVESRLIAFRNVYYPSRDDTEWNLGLDMGFSPETLRQVANLQMVCVHPDYRGNALARKMNRVALYLLKKLGRRPQVCATVSPHNVWNIRILLNSGFYIRALKRKYGGKLRYIVHQNLQSPSPEFDGSAVWVSCDDMQRIEALLCAGYLGVSIAKDNGPETERESSGYNILFQRPRMVATAPEAVCRTESLAHGMTLQSTFQEPLTPAFLGTIREVTHASLAH